MVINCHHCVMVINCYHCVMVINCHHCVMVIDCYHCVMVIDCHHCVMVRMTSDDPRWVGAWWLGFILAAAVNLLVSFPILCFGAELPSEYMCQVGVFGLVAKCSTGK